MNRQATRIIVQNAVIAALYCALTLSLGDVAFGPIQFRPAEGLTLLPFLYPSSVLGLFTGCFLSNLMSGYGMLDIVLGSLATLTAAYLTSRCKRLWAAAIPPVVINAVVVGFVIMAGTAGAGLSAWAANGLSIGVCEALSVAALGVPLTLALKKLGLARAEDGGRNRGF